MIALRRLQTVDPLRADAMLLAAEALAESYDRAPGKKR